MKNGIEKKLIVQLAVLVLVFLSFSAIGLGEQAQWDCPDCGKTGNTGNFCGNCGKPAPVSAGGLAAGQIIHWQNYDLTVESVRVAPGKEMDDGSTRGTKFATSDDRLFGKIDDDMLEIRLGRDINMEDVRDKEKVGQFLLKDANGNEIPLYCWSWLGVTFTDGKFGDTPVQDYFLIYYMMPEGVSVGDLTFSVR